MKVAERPGEAGVWTDPRRSTGPIASRRQSGYAGPGGALQHVIKTLVRTPNCKIDQCSCGAVHVSVGATTVRISDGAARELADAMTRAVATIDDRRSLAPAPVLHLVDTPGDREDPEDGGPQLH